MFRGFLCWIASPGYPKKATCGMFLRTGAGLQLCDDLFVGRVQLGLSSVFERGRVICTHLSRGHVPILSRDPSFQKTSRIQGAVKWIFTAERKQAGHAGGKDRWHPNAGPSLHAALRSPLRALGLRHYVYRRRRGAVLKAPRCWGQSGEAAFNPQSGLRFCGRSQK